MNNLVAYMYLFGLPAILIIFVTAIGIYLLRRGRRNQKASMMACGIAIVIASISVALGLIWFVVATLLNANTMARISFLGLPPLALASIIFVAAILVSLALLYLWVKSSSFQTAGYTQLPNLFAILIAFSILIAASAFAWEKSLGARWHMWPYTSLSGSSGNPLVLYGWNPGKRERSAIVSIDRKNAPDWLASFELDSMDSAGNINVRLEPVDGISGNEIRRLIPFEPSFYILNKDGQLVRIE